MRFLRLDYAGVSLMSKYGKIHVVYGDDRKGSFALAGGAVRAAGAGLGVGFMRFDNTGGRYADVLEDIPGIDYMRYESREINQDGGMRRWPELALDYAIACSDRELDVLILDGLLNAEDPWVESTDELIALMDYAAGKEIELMMSGHRCNDEIIGRADYVSEIKNLKSPHASWIYGREGDICKIRGPGKGKTTMLVGEAIYYAGEGKDVHFVQFMKDGTSSEVGIIENIPGIKYMCPGDHEFIYTGDSPTDEQMRHARLALKYVYSALDRGADMVACDELLTANTCMTLSTDEIKDLVNYAKDKKVKLMMSGHSSNTAISNAADCMYEIDQIRHPYYDGLAARSGIEY